MTRPIRVVLDTNIAKDGDVDYLITGDQEQTLGLSEAQMKNAWFFYKRWASPRPLKTLS